ncbi:hypothetical protein BDY24DRAFT_240857 [Mrakia frigida]|uniref:uncharacterized protein n=1 Tax=Mrakia frigida TaxID=29902 RepID=UPI003FCC265D
MHQKKKKRKMGTEQSPEMEVATFVPKQGNAVKVVHVSPPRRSSNQVVKPDSKPSIEIIDLCTPPPGSPDPILLQAHVASTSKQSTDLPPADPLDPEAVQELLIGVGLRFVRLLFAASPLRELIKLNLAYIYISPKKSKGRGPLPSDDLRVGNLNEAVDDDDLAEAFETYGRIVR